jgi:Flp pilus assembly protein TadD
MPWKFREQPVVQPWRPSPVFKVAVVFLACLMIAAVPYGWIRYQRWNERRQLGRAQSSLLRGDFKGALLEARGVLLKNPQNSMAREIVERSTAALKAPDAMAWRRMQEAMETHDADQLLGLAEAAIKAEDFATAEQVLEKVSAEDRNSAHFHGLAARVATRKGDGAGAAAHWTEAIRLDPAGDEYRLPLAALQLASDQLETRVAAMKTIQEIKAKPAGRLPALRLLIEDAMRLEDRARARELALDLAADPAAEFADQLVLLGALHALQPKRDEEFATHLARVQALAAADQRQTFLLVSWMVDHELALLVPEWERQLPPEYGAGPPVAPAFAAADVRASDWERLRRRTEAAAWGDMEFMRQAFFSLALDHLGEAKPAEAAWNEALKAAQSRPELLERLARVTYLWGWKERTEEVLWKLAPSEWCPRWAMDYLWSAAYGRGDTAKLFEVSKVRLKAQPGSVNARNNHLTLALLLGEGGESTRRLAEALYRENPQDVISASTYAFALYQQGLVKEAVAVFADFSAEELRNPAVAQYYGSFLATVGETARAEEYLRLAATARALPEEKRLVDFAAALCRARSLEVRGDEVGSSVAWKEALAAADGQAERLEALAKLAFEWNWQPRGEAALLQLAGLDRCPAWGRGQLWAAALKSGDSAQIFQASRLLTKSQPESVAARNDFLLLALLGRREKEAPFSTVEAFCKQHAEKPEVVATYGLALLQQGKADAAVALMEALPAAQRDEPPAALYHGIFLVAARRAGEAEERLNRGVSAVRFPEEKALAGLLRRGFEAVNLERAKDGQAAETAWRQALAAAQDRADWLELLAKMAVKVGSPRQAEAALWKLSATERCPRWAIDALWTNLRQKGSSADRYKASKLLVKADAKNLVARRDSIVLALLTGQEVDAPHRLAETFYKANIAEPSAIIAYGLSLHLQDRTEEALKLLAALSPEQLREPHTALYYGLFLAASGASEKALEPLRLGAVAPMLPEERAFLEKVAAADPLKAVLVPRPL